MATITTLPLVRHLRASATTHVQHLSAGQVRHSSPGASFWFRPLSAAISEVPVDDREQEVLVRLRTTDLQEVAAPGTVTYRFARPEVAATRIDFSIDLGSGSWLERPLERVGAAIHGATATAVTSALSGLDLVHALTGDLAELGRTVTEHLSADERLLSVGIEVVGVRFSVLRPDSDVERALQAPHLTLPRPTDRTLAWFVREPWPSPSTGASLASGTIATAPRTVHIESDTLVAFGDGMEDDRLTLSWGQDLTVSIADRTLVTVQ